MTILTLLREVHCPTTPMIRNSLIQPHDLSRVEKTIYADLTCADQWFDQNRMKRNSSKYRVMIMGNIKND